MVEFQIMVVMFSTVGHHHSTAGQVNALDVAIEEFHSPQQLAHRVHDVGKVQIACRYLVQHGRKEKEVLTIHQSHFDARIACHGLFQTQGGVQAAERTSKDQ